MLQFLKTLALLASLPLVALVIFFFWGSSGSYPKQKYNEIVNYENTAVEQAGNTDDIFTVVSYNIGYLSGLANAASSDGSVEQSRQLFDDNLKTAVAALQKQNVDLIGLQEIDIDSKRSYRVNQVTELAQAMRLRAAAIGINWDMNYVPFPFWPISAHFGRTVAGQAVLSRYPIQTSERIVLEKVKSQPFYYQAFYLDRVAQVAQIDLNGTPLILINVHLEAFDQSTRINQTRVVKELAERYAETYPVLLIGDFNSSLTRQSESDPSINLLLNSQILRSAASVEQLKSKSMLTFPSNSPIDTFDYIFYNPNRVEIVETRVVTEAAQASDHLPLLTRFRLQ